MSCLNRTIIGLKVVKGVPRTTFLIGLNRTIIGLKEQGVSPVLSSLPSLNRTIIGLKVKRAVARAARLHV